MWASEHVEPVEPTPSTSTPARIPIKLLDYQVPHVARMKEIMNRYPYCFDRSMLGTGKTYTALDLAGSLGVNHIMIIATKTVAGKWMSVAAHHQIPVRVFTYGELKSIRNHNPKHGLLNRRDFVETIQLHNGTERHNKKTRFDITPVWAQMVQEGILLIVDEIQHIKIHTSDQFRAVSALSRAIVDYYEQHPKSRSRVLLLSGSSLDKEQFIISLYKALGIMKNDMLTHMNPQTGVLMWAGAQDIMNLAMQVDRHAYEQVRMRHGHMSMAKTFIYKLFVDVLIRHISCAMSPPESHKRESITSDKYSGYFNVVDPEQTRYLREAVGALKRAVAWSPEGGIGVHNAFQEGMFSQVTKAMSMIESAKAGTFIRLAKQILGRNQNVKVIIGLNYNVSREFITAGLAEYHPLTLSGEIDIRRRQDVINKFQRPTTEFRLLITNIKVASEGIDLDDKDGRFPRVMLISPNYNVIDLYQLGHRVLRIDTKSSSIGYFVFGNGEEMVETKVLHAISKKSGTLKEMHHEQADGGVKFPGDFDSWHENVGTLVPLPEEMKSQRNGTINQASTSHATGVDSDSGSTLSRMHAVLNPPPINYTQMIRDAPTKMTPATPVSNTNIDFLQMVRDNQAALDFELARQLQEELDFEQNL